MSYMAMITNESSGGKERPITTVGQPRKPNEGTPQNPPDKKEDQK
jgi:hypothetical protein